MHNHPVGRRSFLAGLAALGARHQRARGADDDSAAYRETMAKMARAIKLSELDGETPGSPIPLRSDPLLRYGDEARDIYDSSLWAWGDGGRPVAVLKVERLPNQIPARRWIEAVVSLSPRRTVVTFHDRRTWTAKKPGIEPAPLPGAPRPADAAGPRLTQMKALARRFSASVDAGPTRGRLQLRLMTSPLCRYSDEAGGLVDGAVFTFAYGTNPDVLLVFEARQAGDAFPAWTYGLARIGGGTPSVKLDGAEVWTRPFVHIPADHDTYVNRWLAEGDEPR